MKHADGSITCAKCDVEMTTENSSPHNFRPDNKQPHYCRACNNARHTQFYRENSYLKAYSVAWQKANGYKHQKAYAARQRALK